MIARSALSPMLATLIDAPFDNPGWVFEVKWDGFRIVARGKKVKVTLSRGCRSYGLHAAQLE